MKKVLISFVSVILAIIAVLTPSVGAFALSESENNDTIQNANKIEVNEVVYGRINNTNWDMDYYKFTIPNDGYVYFRTEHDYFDSSQFNDYNIWLCYGEDSIIAIMDASDSEISSFGKIGLEAGTYYVYISSSTGTFDYNFIVNYEASNYWETDGNDNIKRADKIDVNQTYYGSTGKDDDDYFKFEVPSDGFASITFNHNYIENDSDFSDVRLFKYDGTEESNLLYFDSRYQSEITNSVNCGLEAGTYYVCISSYYYSNRDSYNFIVNYTASDDWEKEINDNHALANTVDIGKTYYGSINKGDEDYFKFTTETDGYINLKLMHDYLESDDVFAKVSMYSYNGTEKNIITSFKSKFSWEGVSSGKEFLEAGTYYFYLDSSGTVGEQYSFILEFFENLPETTVIETTTSEHDYSYEFEETTYNQNFEKSNESVTNAGEIILVVLLIAVLIAAIFFVSKNKKYN